MIYALSMVWHERRRYLPAILTLTFSTLLIALQSGILSGMFALVSIPIDDGQADIWVGYPGVRSVDLAMPIPEDWRQHLARHPEVERTEAYLQGYVNWRQAGLGVESCIIIGSRMEDDALGAIREIAPDLRLRLREPDTVAVAEPDRQYLGNPEIGQVADLSGHRVRVVGFVPHVKGLGGAYLFCSLDTARTLLEGTGVGRDQATFLIARCHSHDDAARVVDKLRSDRRFSSFTREEFSVSSRLYWLTRTKGGQALLSTALLGLLVGAAVTSQTLSSAVAAAAREFAVLQAMGIGAGRMALLVLQQSLVVGVAGVVLAVPVTLGGAWVLGQFGSTVILSPGLLLGSMGTTLVMALLAGVVSLRALRQAEPAALLR
jgi:putative ABC transport system permease protein